MASATKIESFFNDAAYKEILESSETYNTRLCIERRLRMPFLDPQTGTAQNHSALHKSKRQRIPGLREGQLYSYPAARWRKSRRQYLQRSYYRPREPEMLDGDYSNHGVVGGLGGDNMVLASAMEMDSKDSHSGVHVKDEMSNNPWYYDELDAMEMDEYDDPGQDSDLDFEESYSKKKGPKKGRGEGSTRKSKAQTNDRGGSDTPTKKSTGSRRGRKSKLNLDGDRSSSPMTYSTKKSRQSMHIHDDHSNSSFVANLDNPATPHMPSHPPSTQHQMIAPRPELFGAMTEQQTPLVPVAVSNTGAPAAPPGPSAVPLTDGVPGGPPAPTATAANPTEGRDHSRRGEKGKLAAPSPYCDFCLGDTRENKKTGTAEELVSCSDCGRSGHPSCLQFTANMMISVKRYRWQCIECKYCSICGTSDNDDQLLFCDDCDRGYHMYCLSPALTSPPEGSWSCKLCVVEFHTPKPKGAPAGSGSPGAPAIGPGAGGAPPSGPPQMPSHGAPPHPQGHPTPPPHHMPPGPGGVGPAMPPSAISQQLQQPPPGPPGPHGYPPGMPPHQQQMMGPHPGAGAGPAPSPLPGPPHSGPVMHPAVGPPPGPPPPQQPPTTHVNPMPSNPTPP